MTNRAIILGCGPSSGVPLASEPGGYWGVCDPHNPKNRRLRSSIFVSYEGVSFLVDASPDLRAQLLAGAITTLDAILITHDHADHTHGLDDVRPLFFGGRKDPFPLYTDPLTLAGLKVRFSYLFGGNSDGILYPPIVTGHGVTGRFNVGGVPVLSLPQEHGSGQSLAFRFGDFAYSTDFSALSDDVCRALGGLDVWVVDCLSMDPRYSHVHLEKTLFYIDKIRPKQAILTHMNHTLDYDVLWGMLPSHVVPAYDTMTIDF